MLRLSRWRTRIGATIRISRNDGRKMPIVETSEPQKPATRRDRDKELAPVDPAGLLHQSLLEEGHDDQSAAECKASGFEKETEQPTEDIETGGLRADTERGERHQRLGRRLAAAQ